MFVPVSVKVIPIKYSNKEDGEFYQEFSDRNQIKLDSKINIDERKISSNVNEPDIYLEPTGSEIFDNLADKLHKEVKVLCWIDTYPKNHKTKAKAVKETWGKRCNKLVFISTGYDEYLDSVVLPLEDGRQHLWYKIRLGFTHVYEKYYKDYDWFIKADDDT